MNAVARRGTASVVSWDAAITPLLPGAPNAAPVPVHSRHRHVVNLLVPGAGLLALASDELDDAPWTIRVADWAAVEPLIGTNVVLSEEGVLLGRDHSLRLDPHTRWFAQPVDLAVVPTLVSIAVVAHDDPVEAKRQARTGAMAMLRMFQRKHYSLLSPEEVEAYPATLEEKKILDFYTQHNVNGTGADVAAVLDALHARTAADEIMLVTTGHSRQVQARTIELLADHYGMPASS